MPWETKSESIDREMKEIDEELIDAVRGYLKDGQTKDEIRKTLKEGPGFSDSDVDHIFELAAKEPVPETPEQKAGKEKEKLVWKIVLALFVIVFLVMVVWGISTGNYTVTVK